MKVSRILVCLDLSTYDKTCISRSVRLTEQLSGVKQITFYHNIKYDFVNELVRFSDTDLHDLKKKIKKDIASRVAKHQVHPDLNVEVVVSARQNTIDGIIDMINDEQCLVFMGLKSDMDGKGIVPLELVRRDRSTSYYYLCTAKKEPKGKKIVLRGLRRSPSYYSDVITWLTQLELPLTDLKIERFPLAYFPYLQKGNRDIEFKKDVDPNEHPFGRSVQYETVQGHDVVKTTLTYCREKKARLLVMDRIKPGTSTVAERFSIRPEVVKVIQLSKQTDLLLL